MDAALLDPPRRLTVPMPHRAGSPEMGEMSVMDLGDPRRPVDLIFLHANGFNAATYRSLLAPLSGSLRMLVPDLRGHGRTRLSTETRGRWSWNDHRDDLIALLDSLDGPPVVLAGHSMGGTASLLAAAKRPERVSRLVLFDPVVMLPPAALLLPAPLVQAMARRWPIVKGAQKRRERFDSREQALASWRGRGAFNGWSEMALADYVGDAFVDEPAGTVRLACSPDWEASNYAAQSHDPWRALKRLDRPVHILKAEKASTCRLGASPKWPRTTVETVAGGGHLFPMTLPEVARDALFEAAV